MADMAGSTVIHEDGLDSTTLAIAIQEIFGMLSHVLLMKSFLIKKKIMR